jgi:FkbM family methyltransferase
MKFLKQIANKILRKYSFLYNFLRIHALSNEDVDVFLKQWLRGRKDLSLFQIGANDGVSGDLFFKYVRTLNIKNLAVEPILFLYNQLTENYKKGNLTHRSTLLNVGISSNPSETIYYFEPNSSLVVPEYVYQLGSFNKAHLKSLAQNFPNLTVVEKKVETVTVKQLQNQYYNPNIIHIDTEGFDFEVIKTIDFSKPPQLIVFEYIHLNNEDLTAVESFLKSKNYKLTKFKMDIAAELV